MGMGGYWVPMGMGTHCRTLLESFNKFIFKEQIFVMENKEFLRIF
jgi:hypothetical protein